MDVNNTPYFLLREPEEFTHGSGLVAWHEGCQALTLAQDQPLRLPNVGTVEAMASWAAGTPLVFDLFGQIGRIDPGDAGRLQYNAGRGFLPLQDGELHPVAAPVGSFVDLAVGGDGRLAAPYSDGVAGHGLLVFHLGRRWQTWVELPDAPLRAAVDQDKDVWCVGADTLMLLAGEPLPLPYAPQSDRFEPTRDNPRPLSLLWQQALPAGQQPLALCLDENSVYVLTTDADDTQRILVRPRTEVLERPFRSHDIAPDVPFVIDLGMAGPGRLAALSPREPSDSGFTRRDCPVLQLNRDEQSATGDARLVRERYPMLSLAVPRFVSSLDAQLRYQAEADPDFPDFAPRPRELHPLRQPRYPRAARATLQRVLDSGRPDTVWHRLYMEGSIPPGTRVVIYARAYEDPSSRAGVPFVEQPAPLWSGLGSELPFHRGLVVSKVGESGLFELLLQGRNGPVRRLAGRYLQLRIRMESDRRHTPAIHALRVYYPRFSYQEAYLPEYLRQEIGNDSATTDEPANGADVRERFLAALEGVMTPIEGRVAAAEALVHPDATPAEHLPWLGEALGASLPTYWPTARQRRWLHRSGDLQRRRGTLAGLCLALDLALDLATDGAVGRGEVVPVENFRLRRTMATILGIDMDDRDHPLTLGTGMSGNSIVGDSLILSEEDARTFLSLFAPELATTAEQAAVKAFFDRYSHQLTVLLHGRARHERAVVETIMDEHTPAHLKWRLIETDHPFVLGLAPLLAVHTYLEPAPPPRRVELNDTYLGREGLLKNPLALSPRDVNARGS